MLTIGTTGMLGIVVRTVFADAPFSWPPALLCWGLMVGNLPEALLNRYAGGRDGGDKPASSPPSPPRS